MSLSTRLRFGVAAGVLALLAATVAPFRLTLQADLGGPFGAVPPAAVDLLCFLLAPVAAALVGARLGATGDRVHPPAVTATTVAAALVGAALGTPVGLAVSYPVVTLGLVGPEVAWLAVSRPTGGWYLLAVLSVAVAVSVGIAAGAAVAALRDDPPTGRDGRDGEDDGVGEQTSSRGVAVTAALVGLLGAVAGFAVLMEPVTLLFTVGLVAQSPVTYGLLAEVVAPLAAVGVAVAIGSAPSGRRALATTAVAAAVGVAAGAAVAATFAVGVGDVAAPFVGTMLERAALDGVAAATLLTLGTVAGGGLSRGG
ncbi:hypothetical protein ACFO0N_00095 [Halobium salinum]|uniref:Uncharacterized protein n=1 Tax=Halobium salinum TaxID=1364940 RepID=A0ABD5P692_9EURY|nr:hypothetical protein [Halobium salinum]